MAADDHLEIILGICDKCSEYVPFLRVKEDPGRVYKCLTCKTKHEQYINGKVVFNFLEEPWIVKK